MVAPAGGKIVELAVKITGIETGEPRRMPSVAFAPNAVTRKAGALRARVAAPEGDYLAIGAKRIGTAGGTAGREQQEQGRIAADWHARGTFAGRGWFQKQGVPKGRRCCRRSK